MQPDIRAKLIKMVERHEGFRSKIYTDTAGKLTIGFGTNLSDDGVTLDEAQYLLTNRLQTAEILAWRNVRCYGVLSDTRKAVIVEMTYNLGIGGVIQFSEMLDAFEKGDYKTAAVCMIQSKWHEQVGKRADELAMIMETGNF